MARFCKKLDPVEHAVLFLKNRASTLTRLTSQVQGKHTHQTGKTLAWTLLATKEGRTWRLSLGM
jgi:hypothetical protein